MISRWALAAGLAAAAVATTVLAQSDSIAARMTLMKGNNNARTVVQMIRGQQPFDASKVEAAFAQWAETAQKLPGLFPENSKTGEKTRAAPAIWDKKNDFDAKAAAFGKVVAANRSNAVASLDALKAAMKPVGDACDNCHKDYRLPRR